MKKLIGVVLMTFSFSNAFGGFGGDNVNHWIFKLSQHLTTCKIYLNQERYKDAKEVCGWAAEYARKLIPYQSSIFSNSVKRDMILALRISCKLGNKQDCGY